MFNEKAKEYSTKQGKEIDVWQSPKYMESRDKAITLLEKYKSLTESDFWILMNETKSGKMAYTGLIISHNGCLKINDEQPPENRFKPSCITITETGYKNSLVYTYINNDQEIYEVGEVSNENCKNPYPYAMALKRCIDRVVLKLTKIAYSGIYSESEADEFKEPIDEKYGWTVEKSDKTENELLMTQKQKDRLIELGADIEKLANYLKTTPDKITAKQASEAIKKKEAAINKEAKNDNNTV